MGSTETKADLERMGFSTYDDFNNDDERPQHRVKIDKPFYMGVHEVTLGQFLQYYNADKANHKTDAEKDGKGCWGRLRFYGAGWKFPGQRFWFVRHARECLGMVSGRV